MQSVSSGIRTWVLVSISMTIQASPESGSKALVEGYGGVEYPFIAIKVTIGVIVSYINYN